MVAEEKEEDYSSVKPFCASFLGLSKFLIDTYGHNFGHALAHVSYLETGSTERIS